MDKDSRGRSDAVARLAADFLAVLALKRRLELDQWNEADLARWDQYIVHSPHRTRVLLGRFAEPEEIFDAEFEISIGEPAKGDSKPRPDYRKPLYPSAIPRQPSPREKAHLLDAALRLMVRTFSKGHVAVDVVNGRLEPVAIDSDGEVILELAQMVQGSGLGVCLLCGKPLTGARRSTRRFCSQSCQKRHRRQVLAIEAAT